MLTGKAARPSDDSPMPLMTSLDGVFAIELGHEAEALDQLMFARVLQHRAVGDQHQGQVAALRVHAGQQAVGLVLDRGVQHPVGDAVAAEEVLQLHHARMVRRADQHRPARAGLDQPDPAQDQGAHDPFAQLRLRDHQAAQALGRDRDGLDLAHGAGVDEGGAARQLAHLGQEVARAVGDDRQVVAQAVAPAHVHPARQDQEHAEPGLPGVHQIVARGEAARLAEAAQPVDLLVRQREIHLLAPGPQDRRGIGLRSILGGHGSLSLADGAGNGSRPAPPVQRQKEGR